MRRQIAAALLALPLTALAVPAQAAPGGGATITKGETGGIYCQQSLYSYSFTTDYMDVAAPGGVETLTCRFSDIANPPAQAVRITGFACSTVFGFTYDSSLVVSPSGNGTLVCRVKRA